jgi:hypothetical protein
MDSPAQPDLTPPSATGHSPLATDGSVWLDSWGDGWPWPVGDILNWLEVAVQEIESWTGDRISDLDNRVQQIVGSWMGWVGDRVNEVWGWIWRHVYDTGQWLWQHIQNIGQWASDTIHGVGGWLWDRLVEVWGWISSTVQAHAGWLWDRLVEVWGWISQHVTAISGWLWDRAVDVWGWTSALVTGWFTSLWEFISSMWDGLGHMIQTAIDGYILAGQATERLIRETWGAATGWMQANIIDPIAEWFSLWTTNAINFVMYIDAWMRNLWPNISRWIWDALVPVLTDAAAWLAHTALPWVGQLIQTAVSGLFEILGSGAPIGPSGAPGRISSILGIASTVGAGLISAQVLPSLIHPMHQMNLSSIGFAIRDISDYGEINRRWVRPAFDAYVGLSSQYYFNSLFTPRIPSPSELLGLVSEYGIDKQVYVDTMRFHGFDADWANVLHQLADRPVPLFRLVDMAMFRTVDPDTVQRELRNAGYNELTIPVLTGFIDGEAFREGARPGLSALFALQRDGFYSPEDVLGELEGLGYGDSYQRGASVAMTWQYAADWVADQLAALRDAVNKDVITLDEYSFRLAELGLRPERVDNEIIRAQIRRTPAPLRPRPEPAKPFYLRPEGQVELRSDAIQYEEGIIDTATYRERLVNMGVPDDLVRAYIDLGNTRRTVDELRGVKPEIPPYETDAGRLNVRTLELLFDREQITAEALAAGLRALAMPPALVAAHVAQSQAKAIQPPGPDEPPYPVFPPGDPNAILLQDARIAFRRAQLTEDQLGDILLRVGYRPQDARRVIDAELLIRQEPFAAEPPIIPPFEPRSPQSILFANSRTAFKQRLLEAPELRDILVYLGYRPQDADLIVAADDLLRRPPVA